jgi:hypothetical protein
MIKTRWRRKRAGSAPRGLEFEGKIEVTARNRRQQRQTKTTSAKHNQQDSFYEF